MPRTSTIRAEIDARLDAMTDRGFEPKIIVLSLDKYQELMQSLASESGRDHLDARLYYKECLLAAVTAPDFLEVTPDAREMWERGAEFAPLENDGPRDSNFPSRREPAQRRVEPRFTEL